MLFEFFFWYNNFLSNNFHPKNYAQKDLLQKIGPKSLVQTNFDPKQFETTQFWFRNVVLPYLRGGLSVLFGCEGGKFLSLRLASISNLSLLLGLEPLKKFLVVVGGGA